MELISADCTDPDMLEWDLEFDCTIPKKQFKYLNKGNILYVKQILPNRVYVYGNEDKRDKAIKIILKGVKYAK